MAKNLNGKIWIKCRRSHSEIFKKTDIERYFDRSEKPAAQDEGFDMKGINKNYEKFEFFSIEPRFRFNELGDNKLEDKDDILYFALYGIDRNSSPLFVSYVYCGYLTSKRSNINKFM